jgi:hypothetical protein
MAFPSTFCNDLHMKFTENPATISELEQGDKQLDTISHTFIQLMDVVQRANIVEPSHHKNL